MAVARILFFGDHLVEKVSAIRNLHKISHTRPQLRQFLQSATDITQVQLSLLASPSEHLDFGHFTDLLELAEQYEASARPDETTGAVLLVVAQIGELLCIAENDTSLLSSCQDVYPLGFCIGMLAASVAAAARDTSQLVRLGVEAVGVAFRLGLELRQRARRIEESTDAWAIVVVALYEDIDKCLQAFNQSIPPIKQAYVGVVTSAWTTVFGPPSTIAALDSSAEFKQFSKSLLTGTTSVHAPHLPPIDVSRVVGDTPILEKTSVCRTIYSCATCSPFRATTVRSLLQQAALDICSSTLWLERTVNALGARLTDLEAILIQVGPTLSTPMVQKLLKSDRVKVYSGPSIQPAPVYSSLREGSGLVAIVGMSGRFPGCDGDIEEFWDLLVAGRTTHQEIPATRFALEEFYDPAQTIKNAVLNRHGCFLNNPGLFDHAFFKISPREAMQMDPLHRMFLMTTHEALERAGYAQDRALSTHPSRISTFWSQTTDDWRTINDQQGVDTHYVTSSNRAFAAGRIAHQFGWGGATYSVDTACSSSLASVHLACHALLRRESDTAIVGGGSLCVIPEPFSGLGKAGFISPSVENGSSKTFQESADGYGRGEAVGVVVLKRLEDAVMENADILAVIRGSARNSNAGEASITYPSEAAQAALFSEILRKSSVHPHDVGYIEVHGTGTQAGDKIEMSSVSRIFAQDRTADNPLYVGSAKANIGHTEAAAGVVSLIKSVLMLRNGGAIPPQPGYPFPLNKAFRNLEAANIKIADGNSCMKAWSKGDGRRKLLVNSFDAAGGNASVLLEEVPTLRPKLALPLPRSSHLIAVSGRTARALKVNKADLKKFLAQNPSISISDVAYTTTAKRIHEEYREAIVVSSVEELNNKLATANQLEGSPVDPDSLIFLFTGQGAAYSGMGATLYETSPCFRRILDSFQQLSVSLGQRVAFIDIIAGTKSLDLASATETQMAILALEVGLAQFWQSLGLVPTLVMGHSLGEYAALCVAGVLSIADALYLVHERASLIERYCEADSYAMLSISQGSTQIQQYLDEAAGSSCDISCVNGPSSTVVSGKHDDLKHLRMNLKTKDIKCAMLRIRYGFHSAQMDPVLEPFEKIARQVVFAKPQIPVASTLLGQIVTDQGAFNSTYLEHQMRRRVDFVGAVRCSEHAKLIRNGSTVVELGPHPICSGLIVQSLQNASIHVCASMAQGGDDWRCINTVLARAYLAKVAVDWQRFYKDDLQSVRAVDLPSRTFDLTNYWQTYQKQSGELIAEEALRSNAAGYPSISRLASSSLQFLEAIDIERGTATFQSRTAEPSLFGAIQGHRVDGTAICPVSVFADMAMTAASYLMGETGAAVKAANMELTNLNMTNPLVVDEDADLNQIVHLHATIQDERREVSIRFSSRRHNEVREHGSCVVRTQASSDERFGEWNRMKKLVRSQVKALEGAAREGSAHRMNTALVYKLFAPVVEYSESYMAIKEACVAFDFEDAFATIDLGQISNVGQFTCSPFAVDAMFHLAGFLLNANLVKSAKDIYISNHIGSLSVLEDVKAMTRSVCTCFASIREETKGGAVWCDVYVFQEERLIAICTNIRFQKMRREAFASIVGKTARDVTPTARYKSSAGHGTIGDEVRSLSSTNDDTTVFTPQSANLSKMLVGTIAYHTGIEASEIGPSSKIADMGIDSLMAIAILGDLDKATSVKLPATFFTSAETMAEAFAELDGQKVDEEVRAEHDEAALIPRSKKRVSESRSEIGDTCDMQVVMESSSMTGSDGSADSAATLAHSSVSTDGNDALESSGYVRPVTKQHLSSIFADEIGRNAAQAIHEEAVMRASTDVVAAAVDRAESGPSFARTYLISGKRDNMERPLFLMTDGSGSVSGYIHLSSLSGGRKTFALESPFLERPQDYTLSIEEMAQVFIRSIRKEQDHGPYLIGGWSAGSVYAYEICRQLAQQGETIALLLLIDMSVPRPVAEAHKIDMAFVEKAGVFTGVQRAPNLLPGLLERQKMHIARSVRALAQYRPAPFLPGHEPRRTHLIWATRGVREHEHDDAGGAPIHVPTDEDTASPMSLSDFAKHLQGMVCGKRMHFGPNGWERLVGSMTRVSTVEGDHFSIVTPPAVQQLSHVIREAVDMHMHLDDTLLSGSPT